MRTGGSNYPMHIVNSTGESLSFRTAAVFVQNLLDYECITKREAKMMLGALSDKVLPFRADVRDKMRALIFKNMIISMLGVE